LNQRIENTSIKQSRFQLLIDGILTCLQVSLALLLLVLSSSLQAAETTYKLGSGYPIGETGIRLGGYANSELKVPRSGNWNLEASDLSLFISWNNGSRLRFFSELEVGDVLRVGEKQGSVTKNATFEFERLYLDTLITNNLTVRVGKFLTPIGQWNLMHASPLIWTTSRPVATENLFSTHASGVMLHGAFTLANRQLEYKFYGDLSEHLDPHRSDNAFEDALGMHLRYFISDNLQIGTSFVSSILNVPRPVRNYMAGLDLAWTYRKMEISSEMVFRSNATGPSQSTGQGFIQSAIPVYDRWFVIGRYEAFTQPHKKTGQVGVLGLAYRPLPPVVWKLEYRLGTHNEIVAPDGLMASVAILF
jgi:hypothetical protein